MCEARRAALIGVCDEDMAITPASFQAVGLTLAQAEATGAVAFALGAVGCASGPDEIFGILPFSQLGRLFGPWGCIRGGRHVYCAGCGQDCALCLVYGTGGWMGGWV